MLRKRIDFYVTRQLDLDKLLKEICDLINRSIETNNPTLLDEWFGDITFKDCLDKQEREMKMPHDKGAIKSVKDFEDMIELDYRSVFYVIGFYIACLRGSIPIVAHYIKKAKFPGDVDRGFGSGWGLEHIGQKDALRGPPLLLAVRSGNLDLVKYIYENTNAMTETSQEPPRERTALMEAIKLGNEGIVEFLLTHNANPNASIPYGESTLYLAIQSKNINIIRSLVNAGAIVTTEEVHRAIRQGVSLEMINFLLLNCVNRENLYHPFLFSAIESGDVSLLLALEKNPLVSSFDKISKFNDGSIDETMVHSAAKSGNVEMMKYLAEIRKIPVKEIFKKDFIELEKQADLDADKKNHQTTYERIDNITSRHLYAAATSHSNDASLLTYICETLALKPTEKMIKTLCDDMSIDQLKVYAYLFRFLEKPPVSETILNDVAFGLEKLSLSQLFQLYNCPLIVNGNHLQKYHHGFREEIAALIKEKESKLDILDILQLLKSDKETAIGALFYYCNNEFDKNSERLIFLLTKLTWSSGMFKNVDIQDCRGDTLAKFAHQRFSSNIVALLFARGADSDVPNNNGETLLYFALSHYQEDKFEQMLSYTTGITHTLSYACKDHYGGYEELKKLLSLTKGETQGVPIAEMVDNCLTADNIRRKFHILFTHLSEANAKAMVALLKDDHFIAEHKISKDTITEIFLLFNSIDKEELSAEEKARRLGTVSPVIIHLGLFHAKSTTKDSAIVADKVKASLA